MFIFRHQIVSLIYSQTVCDDVFSVIKGQLEMACSIIQEGSGLMQAMGKKI